MSRSDLRVVQPVPDTQSIQMQAEGVVEAEGDRVELNGEWFRLADSVGLMPLMAYANSAKQGADSDDFEGLAAMYAMIRDTVDQTRPAKLDPATGEQSRDVAGELEWDGPSEWMRFERHAIESKADGEDLMGFVGRAMEVLAARPRKRREDSSSGSPQTSPPSRPVSSSPAMEGLVPVSRLGEAL
jgi:hypothetical protein